MPYVMFQKRGRVYPVASRLPTLEHPPQKQLFLVPFPHLWGIANTSERGTKAAVAREWADGLHHPCRLGGSLTPHSGEENQKWATHGHIGYITHAVLGGPQHFRAGDKTTMGPQVGILPTSPLPSSKVPNTSEQGTKSKVAHTWADGLHHPCRLGRSPTLQSVE